eukprot:TRINITY_DN17458_c0_g2_i1.p1 TRINITY_DN17458_c0_g2~~TRINITY_DN17458_c0_g2_i1.p1  ORF type:complete len:142 (-),score=1.69 TRINITY_DN17458_c0_g2_i1:257-682(-)
MHSLSTYQIDDERQRITCHETIAPSRCDASVQASSAVQYFCVCDHIQVSLFDGWWRAIEYEGVSPMSKKSLKTLQIQGATITDRLGMRHMAHETHGVLLIPHAEAILARHTPGMELIGIAQRILYRKIDLVQNESGIDTSS